MKLNRKGIDVTVAEHEKAATTAIFGFINGTWQGREENFYRHHHQDIQPQHETKY